jgi:hypothetical protein
MAYSLERRPSGAVVIEEGRIGVSDLAVFYPADHQLALAVVHFLNGDMAEAERLGNRALQPPHRGDVHTLTTLAIFRE